CRWRMDVPVQDSTAGGREPYVAPHAHEPAPAHVTAQVRIGMLWHCSNQPRAGHQDILQAAIRVLAVAYVTALAVRLGRSDPLDAQIVRCLLAAYVIVGALVVRRLSWGWTRAYTVVLSLAFSFGVAWCLGRSGNTLATVPVSALAIMVPMVLLQTG